MSINNNYSRKFSTMILQVREGEDDATAQAAAAKALNDKAISDAVSKAVAEQTAGLKAKNDELLGKLTKSKEREKLFEGLDPVALKEMKDRIDADEDTKLLAEGKKQEVVEKYTQRMRAQHLTELKAKDEQIEAERLRARKYEGSVLDNQILSVAKDLHPGAVEDALLLGRMTFKLNAEGKAVKLGSDGTPELGKDGSTPFSPKEWMEQQKELKPHWFPMGSSGSGGSSGARDASAGVKSIKRADYDRLNPTEQRAKALSGIQILD